MDEAAWVLPDEPIPVRLMNTVWADRAGVHDALITVDDLAAWLASVDRAPSNTPLRPSTTPSRPSTTPSTGELAGARSLRDALRRLAAVQTSDTRTAAASPLHEVDTALHVLNTAAAHLPTPSLTRTATGLGLRTGEETPHSTLARIAAEAVTLLGQSPTSLRACQAPGCVLYFVRDHPRREWCSAACGNRARVARHFARHRGPGAEHGAERDAAAQQVG